MVPLRGGQHALQEVAVLGHTGRVGGAVLRAVQLAGHATIRAVPRGGRVPEHAKGPVWICTTNDALDTVLRELLPRSRAPDVILVQNGDLTDVTSHSGLQLPGRAPPASQPPAAPVTQLLLYAAAQEDGSLVCGGRSAAAGPWAAHCVGVLQAAGVRCAAVSPARLAAASVEKLLWASVAWLMSTATGGLPVGQLVTQPQTLHEFTDLATELLRLACTDPALQMPPPDGDEGTPGLSAAQLLASDEQAVLRGLVEYSLAIAAAVPSRTMAMQELRWRNGYFLRRLAVLRAGGEQSWQHETLHEAWLKKAGVDINLASV